MREINEREREGVSSKGGQAISTDHGRTRPQRKVEGSIVTLKAPLVAKYLLNVRRRKITSKVDKNSTSNSASGSSLGYFISPLEGGRRTGLASNAATEAHGRMFTKGGATAETKSEYTLNAFFRGEGATKWAKENRPGPDQHRGFSIHRPVLRGETACKEGKFPVFGRIKA